MELTSKKYWEDYYAYSPEDKATICKVCSKYDRFYELTINSCTSAPKSIIEVGAFPGRYLAYISSKYGLEATGLDFNPQVDKFTRSMHAMSVRNFKYVNEDFLSYIPERRFDLVFSNGFVEHFENFDFVLDKHFELLNPGGAMMIMIPNKRYLRAIYGNLVDKENQRVHNLECMSLQVLEEFARRNSLSISFLDYFGGFPYRVHQPLNVLQKMIYHPVRFLSIKLNKVLSNWPTRFWSGTIIGIFSSKV